MVLIWKKMKKIQNIFVDLSLDHQFPLEEQVVAILAEELACVDHNKLWKILKEMGISDHLNCPLRNLYTGQEVTATTEQGTPD